MEHGQRFDELLHDEGIDVSCGHEEAVGTAVAVIRALRRLHDETETGIRANMFAARLGCVEDELGACLGD